MPTNLNPSSHLTPGVRFLIKGLAALLAEAIAASGVILVLSRILDLNIPINATWMATIGVRPLRSFVKAQVKRFKEKREMKALGAIEAPSWKGKWFGNMDLVLQFNEQVKTDYVGESWSVADHGNARVRLKLRFRG